MKNPRSMVHGERGIRFAYRSHGGCVGLRLRLPRRRCARRLAAPEHGTLLSSPLFKGGWRRRSRRRGFVPCARTTSDFANPRPSGTPFIPAAAERGLWQNANDGSYPAGDHTGSPLRFTHRRRFCFRPTFVRFRGRTQGYELPAHAGINPSDGRRGKPPCTTPPFQAQT